MLKVVESKNAKNVSFSKLFKQQENANIHFFRVEKEIDHLPASKLKVHLIEAKDAIEVTRRLLEGVGCGLLERSSLHVGLGVPCPHIGQIHNTRIGIDRFHFVSDTMFGV